MYFRFAKTTQFAIPSEYLSELKGTKINKNIFFIPKHTKKYLIWRYGPGWQTPNKNWRLTDGNMVYVNNLKLFWGYYIKCKTFKTSTINNKINKLKKKSLFKFSKEEVIKIKKSKIKSQLY